SSEDTWHVFCYSDVKRVLSDYQVFSSNLPGLDLTGSLLFTDPPRHNELKSLLSPVFTPRAAKQQEALLTEMTNALVDQMSTETDLIASFSSRLPTLMLTILLGVPQNDAAQLNLWAEIFLVKSQEGIPIVPDMSAYFSALIDEKRQHPGDDIISLL